MFLFDNQEQVDLPSDLVENLLALPFRYLFCQRVQRVGRGVHGPAFLNLWQGGFIEPARGRVFQLLQRLIHLRNVICLGIDLGDQIKGL